MQYVLLLKPSICVCEMKANSCENALPRPLHGVWVDRSAVELSVSNRYYDSCSCVGPPTQSYRRSCSFGANQIVRLASLSNCDLGISDTHPARFQRPLKQGCVTHHKHSELPATGVSPISSVSRIKLHHKPALRGWRPSYVKRRPLSSRWADQQTR